MPPRKLKGGAKLQKKGSKGIEKVFIPVIAQINDFEEDCLDEMSEKVPVVYKDDDDGDGTEDILQNIDDNSRDEDYSSSDADYCRSGEEKKDSKIARLDLDAFDADDYS